MAGLEAGKRKGNDDEMDSPIRDAVSRFETRLFVAGDGGGEMTMKEFKRFNRRNGYHFFDRDALAFFDSRIETEMLYDRWFVTSEQFDKDSERLYSVREAMEDGSVKTIGGFQMFETLDGAIEAVKDAEWMVALPKCAPYVVETNGGQK